MRQEVEDVVLPSFLGDLSPREAERLLGDAPVVTLPPGATILGPDEDRLWLVVRGLVRIFMLTPEGRQLILLHAVPGDTIGLASLFVDGGGLGAQTVVRSRLLSLDRHRMQALVHANPAANQAAAAEVVEQSHRTLEAMAARSIRTVRQRIVEYIVALQSRSPAPAIPITQQELADSVGCSREAVSRSLAGLRRQGLVATEPSRLTVLLPESLRQECAAGAGG